MEDKSYIVVEKGSIEELENKVHEYVQKGYTPIGGVSIHGNMMTKYRQAVYKRVVNKNPNI